MLERTTVRILVVNGKGGCGKTTIATNLACAYAHQGRRVCLLDYDAQASSTDWWERRPGDLPGLSLVEAHRRTSMYATRAFQTRMPRETDTIIVDTPSAVGERDLEELLRGVTLVMIPLLPSPIDIRAGMHFTGQLLEHRAFRRNPVPVGAVANRVRRDRVKHSKLEEAIACLGLSTVAMFRDSAVYPHLADEGLGLFDCRDTIDARHEVSEWQQLLEWIDAAASGRVEACAQPLAAEQRSRRVARLTRA